MVTSAHLLIRRLNAAFRNGKPALIRLKNDSHSFATVSIVSADYGKRFRG